MRIKISFKFLFLKKKKKKKKTIQSSIYRFYQLNQLNILFYIINLILKLRSI